MAQYYNLIIFILGVVFGSGVFYSLTLNEIKNQKETNKLFNEKLNDLHKKIDCLQECFVKLIERIARLESKINGKTN